MKKTLEEIFNETCAKITDPNRSHMKLLLEAAKENYSMTECLEYLKIDTPNKVQNFRNNVTNKLKHYIASKDFNISMVEAEQLFSKKNKDEAALERKKAVLAKLPKTTRAGGSQQVDYSQDLGF